MKTFRSVLFWLHLAAGLLAGLVVGIMCFTGAALAFEQEIVAWAERDARKVTPPARGTALPLADLQRKLRETSICGPTSARSSGRWRSVEFTFQPTSPLIT